MLLDNHVFVQKIIDDIDNHIINKENIIDNIQDYYESIYGISCIKDSEIANHALKSPFIPQIFLSFKNPGILPHNILKIQKQENNQYRLFMDYSLSDYSINAIFDKDTIFLDMDHIRVYSNIIKPEDITQIMIEGYDDLRFIDLENNTKSNQQKNINTYTDFIEKQQIAAIEEER